MVVGILFGLYWNRVPPAPNRSPMLGWFLDSLVLWILLALLGWQVFGPAIHR